MKKNSKKMGWLFFNLFGKVDAVDYFQFINYAHVYACSPSYTDEE